MTVSVLLKETGITLCGVVVASSIIQLLSSVRTNCFLAIHRTADNKTRSTWFARGMSVIQSWTTRHLLWVMACFYAMLLYFVFRTALIAPEGSFLSHLSVLLSIDPQRWQQFHSNVGKAYLGESQLIRKAENPFSFLQGEERLWSMMVRHSHPTTQPTSISIQSSSSYVNHHTNGFEKFDLLSKLVTLPFPLSYSRHRHVVIVSTFSLFLSTVVAGGTLCRICFRLHSHSVLIYRYVMNYRYYQSPSTNHPMTQYMILYSTLII